jgi:hypothetical protein
MMHYRQVAWRFCSPAQRPNLAREQTVAATDRLDDLLDCVDHKLRVLLMHFVQLGNSFSLAANKIKLVTQSADVAKWQTQRT